MQTLVHEPRGRVNSFEKREYAQRARKITAAVSCARYVVEGASL